MLEIDELYNSLVDYAVCELRKIDNPTYQDVDRLLDTFNRDDNMFIVEYCILNNIGEYPYKVFTKKVLEKLK